MPFDKNLVSITALDNPVKIDSGLPSYRVADILYGGGRVGSICVYLVGGSVEDHDDEEGEYAGSSAQHHWPGIELPYGWVLDDMYVFPIDSTTGFKYSGHQCPISKDWLSQPQLMGELLVVLEQRYDEAYQLASSLGMIPGPT